MTSDGGLGKSFAVNGPFPLALRVRALRELGGITRRALSLRAGLDPSHVRLLERSGKQTTATTVGRLAVVLGVRERYLVDGTMPAFELRDDVNPENPAHAIAASELVQEAFSKALEKGPATPEEER